MENRSLILAVIVLVVLLILGAGAWIGVGGVYAERARAAERETAIAAEIAVRAHQAMQSRVEHANDEAHESIDEPASAREPAPRTAADDAAQLEQLLEAVIETAEGPAEEDARTATRALHRAQERLAGWLRAEEQEARAERRDVDATRRATWERAQKWVDAASELDDPAAKQRALAELRDALYAEDPDEVTAALRALARLGEVAFDKEPFRQPILEALEGATGEQRVAALYALFNTSRRPEDLELALAAVTDPEARGSASHLVHLFSEGDLTGATGDAVLPLFDATDDRDLREAMRGMWGAAVSDEIASRVLSLAADGSSLQHDAVYFGLSTWRDKQPEVVERLIEFLETAGSQEEGRALWGLGFGVPEESWPRVTEAMRALFEARSSTSVRVSALERIGLYGTAGDVSWLQSIASNVDAPADVRAAARRALRALSD